MRRRQAPSDPEKQQKMLAGVLCEVEKRQAGYREQALKLFPHVCASCGREFSGKRLSELTVHHKDHNHQNNPSDGSNWELLCIYCHDHEHEKYKLAGQFDGATPSEAPKANPMANPFANLDSLLKDKESEPKK